MPVEGREGMKLLEGSETNRDGLPVDGESDQMKMMMRMNLRGSEEKEHD